MINASRIHKNNGSLIQEAEAKVNTVWRRSSIISKESFRLRRVPKRKCPHVHSRLWPAALDSWVGEQGSAWIESNTIGFPQIYAGANCRRIRTQFQVIGDGWARVDETRVAGDAVSA
jgi:hypothetical protein